MKRSNRLVLLIGVFLAALAFVFVVILLGNGTTGTSPNASAPPAKIATVVAARDVALGVTITKDMLKTQEFAPDVRLPGAFGDPSQVVGSVTRVSIKSGQQITAATFAEQSGANLQVPAGFTAIAVQVDQVSGVGTLIKTGDYVDIVAGVSTGEQKFPILLPGPGTCAVPASTDGPKLPDECYDHTSVKVLIQGVQVITTLLPPPPTTETGAPAPASGTSLNGQQEIVILAVTPQQVEVIKFAQLDGSITLVLRSPADFVDENGNPIVPETVATTGVILKTLVDDWGVLPPSVIFTVIPAP
ncbi:MAG: Flp pilus assembly protein CpaB [Chloroflexota bacterium]